MEARVLARPIEDLPLELSTFIGREREVAEIGRLVSDRRLLTLRGPGGCGKTRLALAVAQELVEEFEDGVWWVELAPISEPELVPRTVASVLGLREKPDLPFTEALVAFLRSRNLLLILDNCEHLIEACASLVDTLLNSCGHLRVMATSREDLRVAGESSWMVPSLTVPEEAGDPPDPELLTSYEAVQLFVERARARQPGFVLTPQNAAAVVDICRRLDGIPLALELATARMGALGVSQIAERLGDALGLLTKGERTSAPRQRTLKATLGWSHDLLSGPEQALFGRLSVFAGGWSLEAAEAVGAGSGIEEGEVLDLLSRLVDKSLVLVTGRTGEARYRLLETVRQYASDKLAAGGEEEVVRQRHAVFFLGLAERAELELSGTQQVAWLDRLERELGNLREALGWFRESGQWPARLRLAGSLWRFCYLRGHYEEGRGWLEGALATEDDEPSSARAKACLGAGALTFLQCDYDRASERLQEALALYRSLRDDRGVASASQLLGSIARERGEYARSEALHEESLAYYRKLGDEVGEAQSLNYLAYVAWLQGKHARARELCEETLYRFRALGDNEIIAWALISHGASALYAGDRPRALALLGESRALSEEVGYKEGVAWSLNLLGVLAHRAGDDQLARGLLVDSLRIHQDLGDRWRSASVLEALGEVLCAQRHPEPAACLFGAARAVREAIAVPVPFCERAGLEQSISATRAALGETAFGTAFSRGRTMSAQQAVEYAPRESMAPDAVTQTHVPSPAQPSAEHSEEDIQLPIPRTASLHIFALGRARVEKEGLPLESQDWIQKPRELLYFLLSHPEGRTKEQVGLALWPEASTSRLRSSFHDALYRLRRSLGGKEWVSFEKGRYRFGRSLPYSYDVEAFEKDIAEARRLSVEAPERAILHLQAAAALYGGDFLEDLAVEGEWAMERQDELRRAHGGALLLLGELLSSRGRHADAEETYRKAISHDRFSEEAHRGLMRSQAALGEPGGALRHYEELAKLLQEQLGASPAPKTLALYERLRAGEEF